MRREGSVRRRRKRRYHRHGPRPRRIRPRLSASRKKRDRHVQGDVDTHMHKHHTQTDRHTQTMSIHVLADVADDGVAFHLVLGCHLAVRRTSTTGSCWFFSRSAHVVTRRG